MKNLAIVISLLFCSLIYGQEQQETVKKLAFARISPEKKFENDLKRNSFTIYTLGGLKPYDQVITRAFQEKFNITYHDFGCLAPGNMEFYDTYNVLVFEYLTKKWGKEWQENIKDNAMNLYQWQEDAAK